MKSRAHLIKNVTPTGTKTGKEIVQSNNPDKMNSFTIKSEMNCQTIIKFNTPDLKHINGIIETNQKCEKRKHKMLNKQSSTNSNVRIRRIQNIDKNKSCMRLNIELNGVKVKAVLDTGSPVSIISTKHAHCKLRQFQR